MKNSKKGRLSSRDRELMMSCLIRNEGTFEAFRDILGPEHFGLRDAGYGLVWKIVLEYHDTYGRMVEREFLLTEVQSIYDADPELIVPEALDKLSELIDFAFDPKSFKFDLQTDEKYTRWAVKRVKMFLDEQLLESVGDTIKTDGSEVLEDLPGFLRRFQIQSEKISSIGSGPSQVPFPREWDKNAGLELESTGCEFLNRFLGGGHCPGEVYGMMGPFGSCKTTLAVQSTVESAKRAHGRVREFEESGEEWEGPLPMAFYFGYEAQLDPELRHRSLGYLARIKRKSLETMSSMSDLSTHDKLKSYERAEFRSKLELGETVDGEQERASRAIKLLNKHVRFFDMTGSDPDNQGVGYGMIDEIMQIVDNEIRRSDVTPTVIWVDYVGAMVKKNLASTGADQAMNYRHLVNAAALGAKTMAQKFKCPVWLLHQLSGMANAKSPGAKLHHTDAAESKSFAENLDFSFVIGNPTDSDLCVLSCTKHRRRPRMDYTIIKVNGEMYRVEDTHGEYTIDSSDYRIKRRSDMVVVKKPDETENEDYFETEL